MIKKLFTVMLIIALSITSLFACSKDGAGDSKESNGNKSEEDVEWIEVSFKDLYAEKSSVDGEEAIVYELYAELEEEKEMFILSENQYEALWYYCYGLSTSSKNDFHLYIAYDETKDEETTAKGIVTDYKIVNNNETISKNGDVEEAKKYFIEAEELFEVGEGDFIMSVYTEGYQLEGDNAYVMYTSYWYEDDGSVDMESLSEYQRVIGSTIIYKKDNEELFNQLAEYADKKIDYIKCTAKCDVKVVKVLGNPSNEFQILEINEIVTK